MEVAVESEDDLFFADLSKQISLLIMDDDDVPVARCPSVSFQGLSHPNYPIAQSPFLQDQFCNRESKGTGVFIPRSSQPRRKHRQGRYSSCNTKSNSNRQLDYKRMVSQASYNNSFQPRNG